MDDIARERSDRDYKRYLRKQRLHRAEELVSHRKQLSRLKKLNAGTIPGDEEIAELEAAAQRQAAEKQRSLEEEVQQRTLEVQTSWTKRVRQIRMHTSTAVFSTGRKWAPPLHWTPPSASVIPRRKHKPLPDEDAGRLAFDH